MLYPLISLPYNSKIIFISLYTYDNEDELDNSKKIYVTYQNLTDQELDEYKLSKNFYSFNYLTDDILLITYIIPNNFIDDVDLIIKGDYTKTSDNYKKTIISAFKNNNDVLKKLKYILNPSEDDYKQKSKDLLIKDIKVFSKELSSLIDEVDECFFISNFLKIS